MASPRMTSAEFAAARQRLGWSLVDAAVECNVTPNVIEGFENGAVKIPKAIARNIRFQSAMREREDLLAAANFPECAEAIELEAALVASGGRNLTAASDALLTHLKSCSLCGARRDYLNRHGPPIPELPTSTVYRILRRLNALLNRLPRAIRPPEGDAGDGRRTGFFAAAALSAFASGIFLLFTIARAIHLGWDPQSWRIIGPLGGVILGYFVGFYLAGWAWDALRPIGNRFLGYVLRFGLAGAAIYGTIAAIVPLIDDDKTMSLGESLAFIGTVSGIWAVIGAGVWVKNRWWGKLAKR